MKYITSLNGPKIPFGWYEKGFDLEDTEKDGVESHASYVTHHNGPRYFSYASKNKAIRADLHGLGDFFSAVQNKALPAQGDVFWVKGGYTNTLSLKPVDPDTKV